MHKHVTDGTVTARYSLFTPSLGQGAQIGGAAGMFYLDAPARIRFPARISNGGDTAMTAVDSVVLTYLDERYFEHQTVVALGVAPVVFGPVRAVNFAELVLTGQPNAKMDQRGWIQAEVAPDVWANAWQMHSERVVSPAVTLPRLVNPDRPLGERLERAYPDQVPRDWYLDSVEFGVPNGGGVVVRLEAKAPGGDWRAFQMQWVGKDSPRVVRNVGLRSRPGTEYRGLVAESYNAATGIMLMEITFKGRLS